jgi:hypothetical protein
VVLRVVSNAKGLRDHYRIRGETAVVGAPFVGFSDKGAVYVFSSNGTTWTEQQKLVAPNPHNDDFGYSVCISGSRIVAGAPLDTDSVHEQGSAHVFCDCLVRFTSFGDGTAGSGGFVPLLAGIDGPRDGGFRVTMSGGLGLAPAIMLVGLATAEIPLYDGHIYVDLGQPFVLFRFELDGPSGNGNGDASFTLDATPYAGLTMYLQAAIADPAGVFQVVLTNALEMQVAQ